MLRRLLVSGALVVSALVAPVAVTALPAHAATHSAAASCYRQVGEPLAVHHPGRLLPGRRAWEVRVRQGHQEALQVLVLLQ